MAFFLSTVAGAEGTDVRVTDGTGNGGEQEEERLGWMLASCVKLPALGLRDCC